MTRHPIPTPVAATIGDICYGVEISSPIDLSVVVDFDGEQPNAFNLPRATARHVASDCFVGDTRRGGSCNCVTITMTPHGNGTHTECIGHISHERFTLPALVRPLVTPATLVSVRPVPAWQSDDAEPHQDERDLVIDRRALDSALGALARAPREFHHALIVRTIPNPPAKKRAKYSGKNPPYFTPAAMSLLRAWGTEHLLCDLPSVDREDDGGLLAAHRMFWGVAAHPSVPAEPNGRTITEMIFVDDSVSDGLYLLDLQIPPLLVEAAPSRPVLYPIQRLQPEQTRERP